jgi:LmbE family N-acetylglucosaminyl deacetylase
VANEAPPVLVKGRVLAKRTPKLERRNAWAPTVLVRVEVTAERKAMVEVNKQQITINKWVTKGCILWCEREQESSKIKKVSKKR